MGGDEHLDSVIRLRRKIADGEKHLDSSTILPKIIMEAQFSWNGLHHGWREFLEGVMFVDNAVGGKKGLGGTHYRNPINRTDGWSWPDLDVAYQELCISIDEENVFRGYGAYFHLFVDYCYLGIYLPAEYPRIRDEANSIDVVRFQGQTFETDVFKKEILYPSYAAHQRTHRAVMEECLLYMPDEFTPFGRFIGTKARWKETVRGYFDRYSTIYPNGPLAFTPERLEEFTKRAIDEFINVHPEIIEELQYLRRE